MQFKDVITDPALLALDITDPQQIDFFTRSFDAGRHPADDALVTQVMKAITDPKQMDSYSRPTSGCRYRPTIDDVLRPRDRPCFR